MFIKWVSSCYFKEENYDHIKRKRKQILKIQKYAQPREDIYSINFYIFKQLFLNDYYSGPSIFNVVWGINLTKSKAALMIFGSHMN